MKTLGKIISFFTKYPHVLFGLGISLWISFLVF